MKDKLVSKKAHVGGALALQRAQVHQERRMQSRFHRFTETHKTITLELFKLATSRYAAVRSEAQKILNVTFAYFPYSFSVITPQVLQVLATDPEENHEAHKVLKHFYKQFLYSF